MCVCMQEGQQYCKGGDQGFPGEQENLTGCGGSGHRSVGQHTHTHTHTHTQMHAYIHPHPQILSLITLIGCSRYQPEQDLSLAVAAWL